MKKLIYILLLAAFVACSKDDAEPLKTPPPAPALEIRVTSNSMYPTLFLSQGGNTLADYNVNGPPSTPQEIIHTQQTLDSGKSYLIGSSSFKYMSDTTLYMLDTNIIWNRMVVIIDGTTVYDSLQIKNDPPFTASNQYAFIYMN